MSLLELTVTLSALLLFLAVAMIGREARVGATTEPRTKPAQHKTEKHRLHPTKIVAVDVQSFFRS